MGRGDASNPPVRFVREMDIERFGLVYVAGPEEIDVAVAE